MVLVVWAASFGLNERGLSDVEDNTMSSEEENTLTTPPSRAPHQKASSNQPPNVKGKEPLPPQRRKGKKDKTDAMLREVLELIDFHGVMRRPTWDGVRVLLLLLPLMEGKFPPSVASRCENFSS